MIGSLLITQIRVNCLDELTDELQDKGLSNKTIIYCHAVNRKMLNYAIKRGYISVNPYSMFDLPRVKNFKYTVIAPEQIEYLCAGSRSFCPELYPAIVLAGYYGMRRGEILGLMPSIDYRGGVLSIERTRCIVNGKTVITPCKTDNSQRQLLIATEHQEIFNVSPLNQYLVGCSPYVLYYKFKGLLEDLKMPHMRFHDLRHSYATWMLDANVNPKIVSAVLGHANVGITLDIYSHPNVQMQRACLEAMKK